MSIQLKSPNRDPSKVPSPLKSLRKLNPLGKTTLTLTRVRAIPQYRTHRAHLPYQALCFVECSHDDSATPHDHPTVVLTATTVAAALRVSQRRGDPIRIAFRESVRP
ncbi:hypothetical protein VC83_05634 [Pseudogymnoascus destructans]|uniref:Uncharacterized protein n=1 Tax=Pseudogymnoascus destructans TaxID=655981 RepID=A0A177A6D3_9PEZI|nr:uncharacterized protein VC83_05634 [Pseudogymnoascus destructans]OAF57719.1 hypothetical protein VC83_05634 [Pseudogymnoascus destructans]